MKHDDDHEQETLMEREMQPMNVELRVLQNADRRFTLWFILLLILLLTSIIFNFIAFLWRHPQYEEHLGNLSVLASLPLTQTTFKRDPLFASPSTQGSDEAWASIMPPGDGFVLIHYPGKYGLPPGKDAPQTTGQIYDTSLFHQLHCLAHIRTFLYTLKSSLDANTSAEVWESLLKPQEDHVIHCFDYLRQGIMCAGDLTLEWPRTEEDGRRFAVDGWGIEHQCKDWDAILRAIEEFSVV